MSDWLYPLEWGQTLSNHDWHPMHHTRLLKSRFVVQAVREGRRADIATAVILWSESYLQDPAGTLPDDDVLLADLAKFGADVDGWCAVRAGVLYGWVPVDVPGETFGNPSPRLGHPVIANECRKMYQRKLGRDAGREQHRLSQMGTRVRAKMREAGCPKRTVDAKHIVAAVVRFLDENQMFVTTENVSIALDRVAEMPRIVGATIHGES